MSSEKTRVVFDCMIFLQAAARQEGIAAACLRLAEQRYLNLFISREFQRRFKFIKVVTPETFIQEIKK